LPVKRTITVIFVIRPNGSKLYLNPELIQTVEATPDTVITLVNNKKLIVRDTPQEITERFIEFRRKTLAPFVTREPGQYTGDHSSIQEGNGPINKDQE
jgi:flagellar protein FlbD